MPRSARAYLTEMKETCEYLLDRIEGMTFDGYCQDKTVRLAVERCFITLGEAVKQLHYHHPSIGSVFLERPGMVAFRNVIVHEYWAVDDEDVWSTLITKIRPLKAEIERTLESLEES